MACAARLQDLGAQRQEALAEGGAVPQALHDHVQKAVVLAGLVLQARQRCRQPRPPRASPRWKGSRLRRPCQGQGRGFKQP